jgi:hypothetical protein
MIIAVDKTWRACCSATPEVEQDPSSPSFPQPKINLGTFHFLEKRVQYRISKGFK